MFQKDFTNITTNVVPPFTTLTPSAVSPTGDMELNDPGPQQEPFDHEVEESQQEYPVLHSDSDVGFGSESDCSGVEDVQPVNWTEFLLSHSNPVNQPEIAKNAVVPSKAAWAPFRSQEDFLACLMMGFLRKLLSRSIYLQLRLLLSTSDIIQLPHWDSVQRSRKNIRMLLNFHLKETISVWNNKCYTISLKSILSNELLNPYVTENLDFYPHEVSGSKVNRLSQCFKWREDLSPELRAQMVVNKGKHFYIFEPVELDCKYVVVPIFFYMSGEKLHAKCYIPHFRQQLKGNGIYLIIPSDIKFNSPELLSIDIKHFAKTYTEITYEGGKLLHELCQDVMYEKKDETYSVIRLPNNWREKAQGRIIRHVPITLYADDTSGNKSKQWNKHISFYFTLSGLHPHLTNQEYHMHFLSTSNVATSLELAAPIVDDLNDLATNGYFAYDSSINQEVLIMSVVMAFLADSPMHAEITCTPMPGPSNSPCRACKLSVDKRADKSLLGYVKDFMRISEGNEIPPPRDWSHTITTLHEAWEKVKIKTATKADYVIVTFRYRPILNLAVCPTPPGFDGVKDTPVEILHVFQMGPVKYLLVDFMDGLTEKSKLRVLGHWTSFNTEGINIPILNPAYMVNHYKGFIGKEFKKVVQAAPFVFFPVMKPEQRDLWMALCSLATFIFQTQIDDMDDYIDKLKLHINRFIYYLLKMTAQWVNKPKFHMLLHLPEAILRFGPAALFALENFESFNGVLREQSIHSNRHRPGRDIAIGFCDYQASRLIMSNAHLYNYEDKYHFTASKNVTDMFANNKQIQELFGLHQAPLIQYPALGIAKVPENKQQAVPQHIRDKLQNKVRQVYSIKISQHDLVQSGTFVLVNSTSYGKYVASVNSIWQAIPLDQMKIFLEVTPFHRLEINRFYQMREYQKTDKSIVVREKDIICCLNVQHNCHDGKWMNPTCLVHLSQAQIGKKLPEKIETLI
ncbi:hypothetical protein H4Q26_006744 [Puccinia striiformis f. sp. tritici PST-130]|nr:hypothetical protein H4Q26_006744 [Puccinia striiformis f. sp. tritici PST-130]